MAGMEHKPHYSSPEIDFSGLSPVQVIQLKMQNNIKLTPEEFKLWEEKLAEERNDDQPTRRGKY